MLLLFIVKLQDNVKKNPSYAKASEDNARNQEAKTPKKFQDTRYKKQKSTNNQPVSLGGFGYCCLELF